VFPLIEFTVSGGYHCNRSGLHGMLFRIAVHDNSAQCASPVKIEAERAKPRLAKYEHPWILTILFSHLSSSLDDLKRLPKSAQVQESGDLCSQCKDKIRGARCARNECLCVSQRFPIFSENQANIGVESRFPLAV